jgi:NAD(P)-dependent dehydrogenase (short-subunit alcohol dehydrogenase family)
MTFSSPINSQNSLSSFKGLTVLITGGSSGVGLATAGLFIRENAQVVLVGRHLGSLNAAAKALNAPADQLYCIAGDVSSEGYANKIIFDTKKKFSGVDILINCAGAFRGGSILQMSEEDFDFVSDVNLKGTWLMCKFAARAMLENGGGAIVNVASAISSPVSRSFASAYAASKGGVIALTNALAIELAPKIRVNCVVPGAVQSPMYDLISHFGTDAESLEAKSKLAKVSVHELEATLLKRKVASTDSIKTSESMPSRNNNLASVEQVAEAILALSNPRSDWVTGEKIMIGI